MNRPGLAISSVFLVVLTSCSGTSPGVRVFDPVDEDRWIGSGVSYGPYRDGQYPGGPGPSKAELREDLGIMTRHWNLLRVYGAAGPTEELIEIIAQDGIDMKVMVGAWIAVQERVDENGEVVEVLPDARAANQREVETAIRLANQYPDIVLAVSIGNETQVAWTGHRSRPEVLIGYLREARAGTKVPVTTADDFNFWNKPESQVVADEVDFLTLHMHPLWNGLQLEEALSWTQDIYAEIQAAHPGRTVVIGEMGWATAKHTEGEQARLIQGRPGEAEQSRFYDVFTEWAFRARIPNFFFEAFDENWKGGDHPNEVEKHWGLYRADRSPKLALSAGD